MRTNIHREIGKWSLFALMATLPFSLFLNALCIGMLVVNRLLEGNNNAHFSATPFVLLCSSFFLLLALRGAFSEDIIQTFKITERKASFLLLPLVFFAGRFADKGVLRSAARAFVWALTAAAIFCLGNACLLYFETGETSQFFYHSLGAPLKLHAVYFSMLLMMALFLLEGMIPTEKANRIFTGFFFVMLILLGSKLFILLAVAYALWLLYKHSGPLRSSKWMVAVGVLLLLALALIPNPVQKRFSDISFQRLSLVEAEHIGDDVYLDGFTFRVLQARLAGEILSEGNWLFGVGPEKAQASLDAKYRELGLYQGDGKGDRGFIGYNFHNQFLETTVQGGIVPLLVLLSLFGWIFYYSWKFKSAGLLFTGVVFSLFCMTESVFERQLGVVSFVSFCSLWLLYSCQLNPNEIRNATV